MMQMSSFTASLFGVARLVSCYLTTSPFLPLDCPAGLYQAITHCSCCQRSNQERNETYASYPATLFKGSYDRFACSQ